MGSTSLSQTPSGGKLETAKPRSSWLGSFRIGYPRSKERVPDSRRIYDTFLFDGELDLLEFRLRENYDDTDVFVLVEAAETYRGRPKPFHFEENSARFAWASEKLRPIQMNSLGPKATTPRKRAELQRNAILLALQDASIDDLVLLLDADELPSRSLLQSLRVEGLDRPHRLEMTRHYQKLNFLAPASTCCVDVDQPFAFAGGRIPVPDWNHLTSQWSGRSGVAVPFRAFLGPTGLSPYHLRFSAQPWPVLPGAGRHLTAIDPSAQLSRKLGRVFHSEWATERGLYLPHLLRCERHAVHHRGWWYAEKAPGQLPADLKRLADVCPSMLRSAPLPSLLRRRGVRTWAWLRQSERLPDKLVRSVDDHFERWMPALAPMLLLADALRWTAARLTRRAGKGVAAEGHAHH